MKTKEEILKEATKKTLNIIEGSPLHDAVMKAMEEYAEQQVKLNKMEQNNKQSENNSCTMNGIIYSTELVVIRDWFSPYNSNMKGNYASAEYWAGKLGKETNEFIKDFENGSLDLWFKIYTS